MNAFAQAILDATFEGPLADAATYTAPGGSPVACRVYLTGQDEALGLSGGGNFMAAPVESQPVVEVRRSELAAPGNRGRFALLAADGVTVTRTLEIAGQPLSLDPKRLTWTCVCREIEV